MRTRATRAAGWAVVAAAVTAAAGCGGGTSSVQGKVTHQGKAVVWGTVILVDDRGEYHQGDIDLSGNYRVDKVPAGRVKIGVTSPNPEPPGGRGGGGGGRPGGEKGGLNIEDPREKFLAEKGGKAADRPRPPAGAWFAIPQKYNDPTTSGLTDEVKGGSATINIDLK